MYFSWPRSFTRVSCFQVLLLGLSWACLAISLGSNFSLKFSCGQSLHSAGSDCRGLSRFQTAGRFGSEWCRGIKSGTPFPTKEKGEGKYDEDYPVSSCYEQLLCRCVMQCNLNNWKLPSISFGFKGWRLGGLGPGAQCWCWILLPRMPRLQSAHDTAPAPACLWGGGDYEYHQKPIFLHFFSFFSTHLVFNHTFWWKGSKPFLFHPYYIFFHLKAFSLVKVHDFPWGDEGTAQVTRCPSCLK